MRCDACHAGHACMLGCMPCSFLLRPSPFGISNMPKHNLQLDRGKSNPLFDNWKLARGLSFSEHAVPLDGHVTVLDHSTDYLNTRAAVLHNHLHCQGDSFFVFKTQNGVTSLCEFTMGQQVTLKTVWEPPEGFQTAVASQETAVSGSALQPSVAIVQGSQSPGQLIVSSGNGDMTLVDCSDSRESMAPCFPLRLSEASDEVRSLHVEAASRINAGQMQVIAWAVRQKQGSQSAGCEIFSVTAEKQCESPGTALSVKTVELLQASALPPHAVIVQPESGAILIAASSPEPQQSSDLTPPSQLARPAADDDTDSVSPRTLRQAADRLAKFTSDQPADIAVPRNEFSDLYNEVGPDNVGGMGSEPSCTITMFSPSSRTAPEHNPTAASVDPSSTFSEAVSNDKDSGKPNAQSETSAVGHQPVASEQSADSAGDNRQADGHSSERPAYEASDQIECDPHKVVAVGPGSQQQLLVGLSSDVDCAVVRFVVSGAALGSAHVHTIPALAYVAAGKIHKKFTLLGHPNSKLAAAVVEGNRFSYVYRKTAGQQSTGDSQIIDMGLAEKSASVLGPALHWQDGQDKLLILVSSQLLVYTIAVT